ncbi:uncharacterized protein Bfra_005729 [Botrytis fragariae]|uniref:BTB domain-containing protein n=1 Tax=Botrytis fragariae TaxID=1964551 RepID=A0A8H6EHS8_9HELO|nr:uncharacterized protein Bfra_005729 [Botrytis fragariae]KAF5872370.1 hypothetical protein Bfra_005729 [Botrytis fragariae]
MAMSSSANIVVDPDGDLVLLLNPNTPDPPSFDAMMSALNSTCNTPDTETSSDADVKKRASLDFESSTSDSTLFYHDRILVSSKHMSLASPVFKAIIKGESHEDLVLRTTGKLELPLPDDDPPAMRILIDVIHGRMNSVPLKIDLNLFTQIAILVDRYQCREAVRLLPAIWKDELPSKFSEYAWDDIGRWICIAWQFELHDEFRRATQIVRESCTFSFEVLMATIGYDLPIPKFVAGKFSAILNIETSMSLTLKDKLESSRIEGIHKAVTILKHTLLEYQSSIINCNSSAVPDAVDPLGRQTDRDLSSYRVDCDSMVLGSLIKSAARNGLYPFPEWPYITWSLGSITAKFDLLKADSLCFKLEKGQAAKHDTIKRIRNSVQAIDKSGLSAAACNDFALIS